MQNLEIGNFKGIMFSFFFTAVVYMWCDVWSGSFLESCRTQKLLRKKKKKNVQKKKKRMLFVSLEQLVSPLFTPPLPPEN